VCLFFCEVVKVDLIYKVLLNALLQVSRKHKGCPLKRFELKEFFIFVVTSLERCGFGPRDPFMFRSDLVIVDIHHRSCKTGIGNTELATPKSVSDVR
jgi:hypothetical protein